MTVWDEVRHLHRQLNPGWRPLSLADRLLVEGRLDLVEKLSRIERHDPAFTTIVVPEEGFSDDDTTHNDVLKWLKKHKVNVLNPGQLITRLERAASWRNS
jgi:hypothetical protein